MTRIFFIRDCDHHVDDSLTIAYTAGNEWEVDDDFAARAVAAGAAVFSDFAEDDLIEGSSDDLTGDYGEDD